MNQQHTLKKKERLKSRKQIEALFQSGKSFMLFPFKVYYQFGTGDNTLPPNCLRFGIGVGARNFKKASDRNRIKRLAREAYRLQKTVLQEKLVKSRQHLALFFIYTGKELPDFAVVSVKMKLILERLIKMTDERSVADS